jgi:hypothetical protein
MGAPATSRAESLWISPEFAWRNDAARANLWRDFGDVDPAGRDRNDEKYDDHHQERDE